MTGPPPTPGLRCVACGYDLDGLPPGPCPECGGDIGPDEVALWSRRAAAGRRLRPLAVRSAAAWAGVAMLLSLGAAVCGHDAGFLLGAGAAVGAVLAGSIAAGLLVALPARPWDRPCVQEWWLAHLWVVHLPWLVIPACTVVAFGAAWMDRLAGPGYGILGGVSALGFLVWGLGCLAVWVTWFLRWFEMLRRERVPGVLLGLAGFAAGTASIGAATILGLAGGALAVYGAETWMGVEGLGD